MEHILIIEDDVTLSGLMKDCLEKEGFLVTQVTDGSLAAAEAKRIDPTLILLDLMLPGMDGTSICQQIRSFSHCPILIVSAKNSELDKLLSLGIGADDYITKPFSFLELAGRVRSHIRRYTSFTSRSQAPAASVLTAGFLTIHPDSYTVLVDGAAAMLTRKEFELLLFFVRHPEQVFTKNDLLDEVWGETEYLDENTVAVYIGRLRTKLFKEHDSFIKTIWGVGYKWSVH